MKRLIAVLGAIVLLVSVAAVAAENPAPTKIPKYIWTQQVTIAEGKGANYVKAIAQFKRSAEPLNSNTYWIAAGNLTGDMRQVTYVSFSDKFGGIEQQAAGFGKIYEETMRANPNFAAEIGAVELAPFGTVAQYMPELSYQPEKVALADAKWWKITTIHLKPGYIGEFAELMKQEIELLKKGKLDEHFLLYAVEAGLPTTGSAYYIVVPMKSLSELDVDYSDTAALIFTPIVRRHFESVVKEAVSRIEVQYLMVQPELSRPTPAMLAANTEFWTVKEPPAVAAKGKQPKKSAMEAAKTEQR